MKKINISVIGLGYVGLPLALAFGKYFNTIGYDINKDRIKYLNKNIDKNNETKKIDFKKSKNIYFTHDHNQISISNIYVITVPTPIYKNKKPDYRILKNACEIVGKFLKKNDIVIFESTVYPGMTEDICVPILIKNSRLKYKKDFSVGYSPERINPGDKKRKLENIPKLVSASDNKSLNIISYLYSKIINAKIHKIESIKIAEAAKIIENTQRDINIAFINELSIIFNKLNIDTYKVLEAANTKWNFLNFQPGLVGGHCIGVDPYYLTYIAKKNGYNTKIILSGRELNDNMYKEVTKKIFKQIKIQKLNKNLKILIMGYTFKENCSDVRNSQIIKINKLISKYYHTDIYDPHIYNDIKDKKLNVIKYPKKNYYDVILLAVNHEIFLKLGIRKILKFAKKDRIIFDIKNMFPEYKKSISL